MFRIGLLFLVLATFWGCSEKIESEKPMDKDYELVKLVVFDLIDPKIESFSRNVNNLSLNIDTYCTEASLNSEAAKTSWKKAMLDFHYLEAILFGPLADGHGEVQKLIYSLPQVNADKVIEREIEKAFAKKEAYKMKDVKLAILGLDAVEYTLFGRLNQDSEKRECYYLKHIMGELSEKVAEYKKEWVQQFREPLTKPEVLVDLNRYIDPITRATISFVDQKLKDRKFAAPLGFKDGIVNTCAGEGCSPCLIGENCHLFFTEHPFALIGKEALLENIHAIRDIFTGSSLKGKSFNFGFFSYINNQEVSNKNLNEEMLLEKIEKYVNLMPEQTEFIMQFKDFYLKDESTGQWVENQESLIYRTFIELKNFSDWLKTDFIMDLSIKLPGTVQGDAD